MTTRLTSESYLTHLQTESARFRDVLAAADPGARVPTCPDWSAADLVWHLAEVQWFWTQVISRRPEELSEDLARPPRPEDYAGLLGFFDDASGGLQSALAGADPGEPAWSWARFVPDGQTVGFTMRRQAHEALIHRLDAELTAGITSGDQAPIDAALAADGVAELLEVMYGGEPQAPLVFIPTDPDGGLLAVDLTDTGHRIWVRPGTLGEPGEEAGPHLVVAGIGTTDPDSSDSPITDEPAAVIDGTAAELDVWYWNRGVQAPATAGDPGLLAAFAAAVSPPLE